MRSARRLLQAAIDSATRRTEGGHSKHGNRVAPFAAYRDRPVEFIEEVLGDTLWGEEESPTGSEGQKGVAIAVAKHSRVVVKAGRGVGKTWLAARLTLWWMLTRLDSIVVTTAPTWFGVENLLWRELHDAIENSRVPIRGKLNATELTLGPKWFAVGLSTDKPVRFRGMHADGGVLAVFDEAPGVDDAIWDVAKGFLTQGGALFAIGNPHTRAGAFGRAFEPDTIWSTHSLSCLDAPEKIGDLVLMDPSWIEDMREDYGPVPEQNPVFQVEVMAEFPTEDEALLFPVGVLDRSSAIQRCSGNPGRHLGVDLARFGKDTSVALLLVDGRIAGLHQWAKKDTQASANIVAGLIEKWRVPPENTSLDESGVGGGVLDRLRALGMDVHGVNGGGAPKGEWHELIGRTVPLANRRAELYWVARRLIESGGLCVPTTYHNVRADLSIIPYGYDKKGKLAIPPKDQIKKNLGRSPDFSDALTYALARPGRTRVRARTLKRGTGRRSRPTKKERSRRLPQ